MYIWSARSSKPLISRLNSPHGSWCTYYVQSLSLGPSSLANLDDFPCSLLVAPQDRPRTTISLHKGHLQLRAHNLERRSRRINRTEQRNDGFVPLRRIIGCREVEDEFLWGEFYFCVLFVDLLQEEGSNYCCWRLVEVVSVNNQYQFSNSSLCAGASPTYLTVSNTSSPPPVFPPFFFPLPTNKCLSFSLHPSIRMNSSNSNTLLLQHV
jgi:hypothetical protein